MSSPDPARSPLSSPDASHEKKGPSRIYLKRRQVRPDAVLYAESTLRPLLGLGTAPLEIEIVDGGTKSLVYFLSCEGRRRGVIYLYPDRDSWREYCIALRLGERHDLPVPRLLHARRRGLPGLGPKHWMLTTDYTDGARLLDIEWTTDRLELLADTLARLHAVESPRWGEPRRLRTRPLLRSLEKTIGRRFRRIRSHSARPDDRFVDEVEAFFHRELARLPEPESFQLCHHHLFGDDLILSADESYITIIDCADLGFSRASRDLAAVREGIFPSGTNHWNAFLDAYFRNFPSEIRGEWEQELPLFRAFYLLAKFQNHLGRRKQDAYWQRLRMICGLELPDADSTSPERADWNFGPSTL